MIDRWRKEKGLSREGRTRLSSLLDEPTRGRVVFYDAVPSPGQEGILQLDLLNPHYPDYYENRGATPPSDDQNPRPVYFLGVKPVRNPG